MISDLIIENFQSHKHSILSFSPGINALVGNSDCGKTAVLRALCWAILNSPSGDAYVSDWIKTAKGSIKAGSECSVTIYTEDAMMVKRTRAQSFNGYVVGRHGDDTEFEALRTDVPKQVTDALNIREVNIQKQMDGPFLLSMTPGEVARYINTLVDLTKIDEYQSAVNSLLKSTSSSVKNTEESIQKTKERIAALSWVSDAEVTVEGAITLEEKASAMTHELSALANSIASHSEQHSVIESVNPILDVLGSSIARMEECYGLERGIHQEIESLQRNISQYEEYSRVNYPSEVDDCMNRLDRLNRIIKNSSQAIGDIESTLGAHSKLLVEAQTSDEQLRGIMEQLSTMACPLCGHVGCSSIH